MDASQANENELQKAIDNITNGAATSQSGNGSEVASELEAKIQDQMGTPPAPQVPGVGEMPEMVMPEMPVNSVEAMNPSTTEATPTIVGSGSPVMVNDTPSETQTVPVTVGASGATENAEATEAPSANVPTESAPAPEAASETVPETAPTSEVVAEMGETAVETSGDLGSVKQAMLRDLFPLMDKVELAPEQKYDVYKEMIETTGDRNMIPAAYEAVKGISDDAAKAEALLYLVDKAE